MTPKEAYDDFEARNSRHAVVSMAWLNSKKKDVQGLDDWAFLRVDFEDGSTITLAEEAVEFGRSQGFSPRWAGTEH